MADFEKTFKAVEADPLMAQHRACMWLKANGYSVGAPQINAPQGILKGRYLISKWRNMTKKEQDSLDGVLLGRRGQDAKIVIKKNKPEVGKES